MTLAESLEIKERLVSNAASGVFLVLSNIFLAPAIYESFVIGEAPTAIVYFNLLFASSLYHACQANFGCVVDYADHRKLDYFFVYIALLWTITTGLGRSHALSYRTRSLVFCIFLLPIAIMVIGDYEGVWIYLTAGVLPALIMIALCHNRGVRLFQRPTWVVVSAAIALPAFVFMYTLDKEDYEWAHGLWHVFIMLSIACLVLATKRYHRYADVVDDQDLYPNGPRRIVK